MKQHTHTHTTTIETLRFGVVPFRIQKENRLIRNQPVVSKRFVINKTRKNMLVCVKVHAAARNLCCTGSQFFQFEFP